MIHHRTHLVQSVPNFTCWMGDIIILGHTVGNNHHLIYVKFKLFVPHMIYISAIYVRQLTNSGHRRCAVSK